jgi:hypothetical protein
LLIIMTVVWGIYSFGVWQSYLSMRKQRAGYDLFYLGINGLAEALHGSSLLLGILFFSRARNTMYWKVPFVFGRKVSVATLDWSCFLFIMALSTGLCYGIPVLFHHWYHLPNELPGMPGPVTSLTSSTWYADRYSNFDVWLVHLECTSVLTISGLTIFLIVRSMCLLTWVRTIAVLTGGTIYFFFCLPGPFFFAGLAEFAVSSRFDISAGPSKVLAMMSPIAVFGVNIREIGMPFADDDSTLPFYLFHGLIIACCLAFIRKVGGSLKRTSLVWQERGEA